MKVLLLLLFLICSYFLRLMFAALYIHTHIQHDIFFVGLRLLVIYLLAPNEKIKETAQIYSVVASSVGKKLEV